MGLFSKPKPKPKPTAPAEDLYPVDFYVVFRSKFPGVKLRPGSVLNASIRPEPSNPYDENAIAVYVGNKQAGYLSASSAARHAGRWVKPMQVPAVFRPGNDGEPALYVTLMVPWDE